MKNATSMLVVAILCVAHVAAEPTPAAETSPDHMAIVAPAPRIAMEIPYYVRGYRDARNPTLRHEGHTVYRRVMVAAPVQNRDDAATRARSVVYAPLPTSDELAAELANQRALTAEVEAVQEAMEETERAMREQYEDLLRQAAEVRRLREELEVERDRLRAQPAQKLANDAPPPETAKSTSAPW